MDAALEKVKQQSSAKHYQIFYLQAIKHPTSQSRRDIKCEGGSSLFNQTPPHENIRGSA